MPPLVFFNLGMPPAKRPPSCGAASTVLVEPPPASLLLRFLFELEGTGGAKPPGGLIPGTGGAPAIGPPELGLASTMGADLSLVTVDFNFRPLLMSVSNAPYQRLSAQSSRKASLTQCPCLSIDLGFLLRVHTRPFPAAAGGLAGRPPPGIGGGGGGPPPAPGMGGGGGGGGGGGALMIVQSLDLPKCSFYAAWSGSGVV